MDVTHEGGTSAGVVETPFPTGGVLGAPDGQFSFYVVDAKSKTARLTGNVPSLLSDAAIVDFDLSCGVRHSMWLRYTRRPRCLG